MIERKLAAFGAICLGLAVQGAFAQQDMASRLSGLKLSGDQPIQIESDKLEVNDAESKATFSGNVSVTQGQTQMQAGRMVVFYAKPKEGEAAKSAATGAAGASNIDKLDVEGGVYLKSGDQVATGDRASFDMKTENLVLSGDKVVLSDGPNVLQGCKLTVQMKTGQAKVDGCGGRVKTLITPGSQSN